MDYSGKSMACSFTIFYTYCIFACQILLPQISQTHACRASRQDGAGLDRRMLMRLNH
jgi:hypothetical protein